MTNQKANSLVLNDYKVKSLIPFAHFALAKQYEHNGDFEKAWQNYKLGNDLQFAKLNYKPQSLENYIKAIINQFSKDFILNHQRLGNLNQKQIFIVGTSRSGKTLLENLLSSHPEIRGVGEVGLNAFARYLPPEFKDNRSYPDWCDSMVPSKADHIVNAYLNRILQITDLDKIIVDTMPGNLFAVGLIAILFPNATIIHTSRQPEDAILQMYNRYYGQIHDYTYNYEALKHFYANYIVLIDHWHKVLPNKIIETSYEEIVTQPEHVLDSILSQLSLKSTKLIIPKNYSVEEINFWQNYQYEAMQSDIQSELIL